MWLSSFRGSETKFDSCGDNSVVRTNRAKGRVRSGISNTVSPFLTKNEVIDLSSPELTFGFHEAVAGAEEIKFIHEIFKDFPIAVCFTIESEINLVWA